MLEKKIIMLSSGELRRVQLAEVLQSAPRLLFIDNPYIGLDVNARKQTSDFLTKVAEKGKTTLVLIVSREKDIPDFIQRILPVSNGKVYPICDKKDFLAHLHKEEKSVSYAIDAERRNAILSLPDHENAANGSPVVECNNINISYGSRDIFTDFSWTVQSGERWALNGENGAGKSTTMNIMTGYLGATEGQVLIDGHDILKEPEEAKKNIGYLPEIPPLYMEMTVQEYLEFAAELKGIKKDKREPQIEEVIRLAKLRDVENRLIQNLSKGYKQRVGLAQAVLGFPEIIILDEPTVGLDPKQIIEIRELIRKLAKKHTVILSSHILAEVREVCDYIMIISGGKLVASDTTENLENMMSGKGQIEVEAKASRDEMDHIIRRTGKIKEVKYRTSASGITTAQIIAKGGEDIREELFLAFSHADVPMLTLNQSKTTLEEIFLELTQGSGNRMIKEEK